MTKRARRLGRGLDSLVSDLTRSDGSLADVRAVPGLCESTDHQKPRQPAGSSASLPLDEVVPNPFQPRSNMNDENILSLTESVRRFGVLQPISVRPAGERFEIVAGERRWRAAKGAGLAEVPVVVRDASDEEMLEFALIENLQREDLNAIDRAKAYSELCDRFGLRPEDVGLRVAEDRTTVTNYLRLLELPASIQTLVVQDKLTMGHARCLLGVSDPSRQHRLAESVAENELSVRALEEIVRREKTRRGGASAGISPRDRMRSAHVVDLEHRFEETLKTKVTIHEGRKKDTGRVVIEYFSLDDFDRIARKLGVMLD